MLHSDFLQLGTTVRYRGDIQRRGIDMVKYTIITLVDKTSFVLLFFQMIEMS